MRSLLFVPADSERKLARSQQSGADALILDLEDSVVPANRPSARAQARAFLAEATRVSAAMCASTRWQAERRSMISPRCCRGSRTGSCCRNACRKMCAPSIIT